MEKYHTYIDSPIPWLPQIPDGWTAGKLKRFATPYGGKAIDSDGTIGNVDVYGSGGPFKKTTTAMFSGEAVLFGRKGTLGKPLYVNDSFWAVDTIYYAVCNPEKMITKFLYYLLCIYDWDPYITHTAIPSIVANEVFEGYGLCPPLNEQQAIAAYLDNKIAHIDDLISEAQASIEEYKTWKASIIYEAVTKGLDPNVEMKDSGVEWIGEVSSSWHIAKLGRFVSIHSGITLGKPYPKAAELVELPYLRVANVKADHFDLNDVATIKVTPEEAKKYALKSGQLLMTEGGDRDKLGRGTIWHGEIEPCLHQNHVFAVTCDERWLLTRFLAYLTASPVGREYFDLTAKKTTNLASTNSTTILQFKIPLPSVSEQLSIADYLDKKCSDIDSLISEKESLISDLEAYKKSLIFEVVTGKRKVV